MPAGQMFRGNAGAGLAVAGYMTTGQGYGATRTTGSGIISSGLGGSGGGDIGGCSGKVAAMMKSLTLDIPIVYQSKVSRFPGLHQGLHG